ncbi:MAG: hypothetical protein HRT58_15735 [Crocinitomicaceae bacterium]|nr:hypothetical protein [Flavobacteriales bacterium]NQZ37120.1 hypothetical protein [Crocinitomicaceae bacterium]
MYELSDDQVEYILNNIEKRGVTTEDVRDNILDHVCCIIENEFTVGKDFYKAYEDTIARFYTKELSEIERETENLLTFKYYYAMKRTLKITGLISVILIVLGAIFKVMHWPGAGVMYVSGFAIFCLLFIPLNIVLQYRDDKKKTDKLVMILGLLLVIAGTFGLLFKVMHWPGASFLFFGSLGLFGLVFIPLYFFTRYRNPDTRFNAIIHSTFMMVAASILFALIDLRPTYPVKQSVESLNEYQEANILRIKASNTLLSSELDNAKDLKEASAKIDGRITDIRTNLISKSNAQHNTNKRSSSLKDTRNPDDVRVIVEYFQVSKDEFSYSALENEIDQYNTIIGQLKDSISLRAIDISNLQMKNTVISVVLLELIDIQLQIAMNENSYLSVLRGLQEN